MSRIMRMLTLVLLVVSLSLNICLAGALLSEKSESRRLQMGLMRVKAGERLVAGEKLSEIVGEDAQGIKSRVRYSSLEKPTLIYIFSSTCRWSQRNVENIRVLARSIKESHRVLGISLSEASVEQRLQQAQDLGFPVLFNLSAESREAYRLGGTPQTLLVSADGVVLKNWTGAYTRALAQEIEKSFRLRLPGLTNDEVADRSRRSSLGSS